MIAIPASQSKKQLLAGIVGPAIACGLCLGLALSAIDHHHTNSFVINMLLAGAMLVHLHHGVQESLEAASLTASAAS
jgi:hypothetical protein